jgi:hypothetical protein
MANPCTRHQNKGPGIFQVFSEAKKRRPDSFELGLHGRGEGTKTLIFFVFGIIPADKTLYSKSRANPVKKSNIILTI